MLDLVGRVGVRVVAVQPHLAEPNLAKPRRATPRLAMMLSDRAGLRSAVPATTTVLAGVAADNGIERAITTNVVNQSWQQMAPVKALIPLVGGYVHVHISPPMRTHVRIIASYREHPRSPHR